MSESSIKVRCRTCRKKLKTAETSLPTIKACPMCAVSPFDYIVLDITPTESAQSSPPLTPEKLSRLPRPRFYRPRRKSKQPQLRPDEVYFVRIILIIIAVAIALGGVWLLSRWGNSLWADRMNELDRAENSTYSPSREEIDAEFEKQWKIVRKGVDTVIRYAAEDVAQKRRESGVPDYSPEDAITEAQNKLDTTFKNLGLLPERDDPEATDSFHFPNKNAFDILMNVLLRKTITREQAYQAFKKHAEGYFAFKDRLEAERDPEAKGEAALKFSDILDMELFGKSRQ